MQQRPMGVTILAILAAIGGVFGLLGSLALIGLGGVVGGVVGGSSGLALGGLTVVSGLVLLVLSVAELAVAYGFWTLRPWAWLVGMVVAGLGIVFALLGVLSGGGITGAVLPIIIDAVIIYYLNTMDVRKAFGRGPSGLG